MATSMSPDVLEEAMLEGLKSHVREALREQFEAIAKPIIDEAIASALETFKISLKQYMDAQHMEHVVRIVVTDNRAEKS